MGMNCKSHWAILLRLQCTEYWIDIVLIWTIRTILSLNVIFFAWPEVILHGGSNKDRCYRLTFGLHFFSWNHQCPMQYQHIASVNCDQFVHTESRRWNYIKLQTHTVYMQYGIKLLGGCYNGCSMVRFILCTETARCTKLAATPCRSSLLRWSM